jgi:maltooligosyltrehalose trehalohydrolase
MLWMGEEWGETAPFQFFEDFSDPLIIEGAREGRKRDFAFHGETPPDPHDRATFLASKLQWGLKETPEGHATLSLVRALIALKRSGALGPRDGRRVSVHGDPVSRLIRIETERSLTLLNYADEARAWPEAAGAAQGWRPVLHSLRPLAAGERPASLEAFAAVVCLRD